MKLRALICKPMSGMATLLLAAVFSQTVAAQDPDWIRGNASFGGIPAIRTPAETEKFAREQFELYERLGTALGLRK